jgi:acetyl esterase/lipase
MAARHVSRRRRGARLAAALLSIALAATAGGCARDDDGRGTPVAEGPFRVAGEDYLPGLHADLHLPEGVSVAPVVVLVPGGAWRTADPEGFLPLARWLAGSGIVAVTTTHRAAAAGGRFPEPVAQILCSIDFAVRRALEAGITPSAVVVLGHSSGGHLAALAALAGDRFRAPCPYPPARVDGFVGLAGAYDVARLPDVAEPLFGSTPATEPATWRDGNPLTWVRREGQPRLRVLLAHGTADADLPPSFTTQFAHALRGAGHEVTVSMVEGADHHAIYAAQVVGPPIVAWLMPPGTESPGGTPS